ncbi:hypothetical protein D9M71_682330 [compost metagenome]
MLGFGVASRGVAEIYMPLPKEVADETSLQHNILGLFGDVVVKANGFWMFGIRVGNQLQSYFSCPVRVPVKPGF